MNVLHLQVLKKYLLKHPPLCLSLTHASLYLSTINLDLCLYVIIVVTTLNFHILKVATNVSCSSIMRKYNSYMNIIDNVNFKKKTFKTTSSLENTAMVLLV